MATQNYFKAKNGLEAPSQSTIAVTDSNFPTVRPTLNLDFAGSKSVDSRISFTRASAATYTGADGKIKYAVQNEPRIEYDPVTGECKGLLIEEQRTNLSTYSTHMSLFGGASVTNAYFSSGVLSPAGDMSAVKIIENTVNGQHGIAQSVNVASGTTYTFSVYAKAAGRTIISFTWGSLGFGGFQYTSFDLNAGTVKTATNTTGSIQYVGNGWYRCIGVCTATATISTTHEIKIQTQGLIQNETYAGDGVSGVYIWGVQFEAGSFPTSYIPSTTAFTSRASSATYFDSTGTLRIAGTNQARYGYGYDSTSGKWVSQGLILESAATNLLLYSAIQSSQWSIGSGSVTYNSAVAPDGTNTALTYTCSADADHIYKGLDYAPLAGTNTRIVFSVWVKGTAGQTIRTRILTSGGTSADAETYTTLNGQWQRVEVSGITGTTYTYIYPYDRRTGVGTATNIQIWGGQVETGYVATSYIPTYGASATRAADVSSSAATSRAQEIAIQPFSQLYNQIEGTYTADFTYSGGLIGTAAGSNSIWWDDGTGNNRVAMRVVRDSTTPQADVVIVTNGYGQADTAGLMPLSANTLYKRAFAYATNNAVAYVNGVNESGALSSFTPPWSVNRMIIGGDNLGVCYVKKITYYPKRISNAQLQALTA